MKRRDFSNERSRRFFYFWKGEGEDMTKYYMKGTPFWKLERMMMRAPGNIHCEMEDKEKMKDYECGNCDYYIQDQPCTMVECKCLPERLKEGDLTLGRLAWTLYTSNAAVLGGGRHALSALSLQLQNTQNLTVTADDVDALLVGGDDPAGRS